MEGGTDAIRQIWRFPSRFGDVRNVTRDLRILIDRYGVPPHRIEDMAGALSEACMNAAEHGNGMDPSKWVRVEFAYKDGTIRLCVYDEGGGLEEARTKRRNYLEDAGETARGRGIKLMTELSDELHFYKGPHSFCTELVFHLKGEGHG